MLLLLLLLLLQALMLLWKLRNLQLAPSWAPDLAWASVQTAGFLQNRFGNVSCRHSFRGDLVSFNGTHPAMQNLHRDVEANSIEFGFSKGYEFCL